MTNQYLEKSTPWDLYTENQIKFYQSMTQFMVTTYDTEGASEEELHRIYKESAMRANEFTDQIISGEEDLKHISEDFMLFMSRVMKLKSKKAILNYVRVV